MKRLAMPLLAGLAAIALAQPAAFANGTKAPEAVPLPAQRPEAGGAAPATQAPPAEPETAPETGEPAAPEKADTRLYQTACPAVLSGAVKAKLQPPITDGTCGTHSPYRVSAVMAGGRLVEVTGDAVMNCAMATALAGWADAIAPTADIMFKSPLAAIRVGTSYQCRRRYHEATGPMSEHAFADAIDMPGFRLENGTDIDIGKDWDGVDATRARFLHFAHEAACGHFTTVLGPGANAAHRSHFHLDLSCHGKTCSYRICE